MLSPQLITPPSDLEKSAVPIDDLKQYIGESASDNDVLIDVLGIATTKYLDGWNGILGGHCLVEQTWSQAYDGFSCGEFWTYRNASMTPNVLRLPLYPLLEIVSVKYYDSAGVLQTVSPSAYRALTDTLGSFVASIPGAATPWPVSTYSRSDAVIVEAKFGYGEPADVPEPIRIAICMKVARMYSLAKLGSSSITSGIVRSETVDGIGSQTFASGSDIIQIMRQNTEAEDYLLGPYRRIYL